MDKFRDGDILMFTQEFVRKRFTYHADGTLSYNKNGKKVIANPTKTSKHLSVNINRKPVRFHRIVFLWNHGYLPEYLDHINGNPSDNRIENLRPASKHQNNLNKGKSPFNKSGCKNVSWNKVSKKWVVVMSVHRKYTYIGSFKDLEFADLVATEARNLYHGAYARHS